ncbi:hypothetical protein Tco_0089376 [Tanacetum coccineum]
MESSESIIRMLRSNPPISLIDTQESDNYTEVTYDKEQCLSDHYTAHVTPLAYTPYIPFSATIELTDTLLMGDEVINTIPARETDEFIKSSVDDFFLIPRESEVTSDSDLEYDTPDTTPLPPTDNGEVDFDINSPLGEQLADLLMEDVDITGLPRHLVKQSFNHLFKITNPTKKLSEPLGDDSKPEPFDEFEDISSLDPLLLTLVIDEPALLVTLPTPCTDLLGDARVDIDLPFRENLDTLSMGDREIDFNPIKDI